MMTTVKQRLDALEQSMKPKSHGRPDPAKMRYIGECMRGEHLDKFSIEQIEAAKAMLEAHCK
jgi:hypothetical protein